MYLEYINRLAEINCAVTMMNLGDNLIEERKSIVKFLVVEYIIKLDPNGGFYFIGENAKSNKQEYKLTFDNF